MLLVVFQPALQGILSHKTHTPPPKSEAGARSSELMQSGRQADQQTTAAWSPLGSNGNNMIVEIQLCTWGCSTFGLCCWGIHLGSAPFPPAPPMMIEWQDQHWRQDALPADAFVQGHNNFIGHTLVSHA